MSQFPLNITGAEIQMEFFDTFHLAFFLFQKQRLTTQPNEYLLRSKSHFVL